MYCLSRRHTGVIGLFFIFIFLGLVACGEDNGHNDAASANHDDAQMTPEEEACLHAREDLPLTRPAAAERAEAEDNIAQPHTHFRVELSALDEDLFGGYLRYDVDSSGEYAFFVSTEIPVAFVDKDGDEIDSTVSDVDECPEVSTRHIVDLEASDHFVRFGPTAEEEVFTVTERLH